MLVIFITHAEAQWVDRSHFRALRDRGRAQVDETAARFRTVILDLAPDLHSKEIYIGEIIRSPMPRCVEADLGFSDTIQDLTETSEIRVRDRLKEQRADQLTAGDLVSVLDDTTSPAALTCTHGDLAGALPMRAALKPEYSRNSWFERVRPVLVFVKYERGSEWNSANVLCCESPICNWEWETLLAQ